MRLFFFKFEPQKRQMMAVKTERREGPEKQIFYFIFFFLPKHSTVNSTIENHRQWRTTRKDIAEFLET